MHKPPYKDPALEDGGIKVQMQGDFASWLPAGQTPCSLQGEYHLHKKSAKAKRQTWADQDGTARHMVSWNLWLYRESREDALRVYLQLVTREALLRYATTSPASIEFLPCANDAAPQNVVARLRGPDGIKEFPFEQQGGHVWWKSYCTVRRCFEEETGFDGDLERVLKKPNDQFDEEEEFARCLREHDLGMREEQLASELSELREGADAIANILSNKMAARRERKGDDHAEQDPSPGCHGASSVTDWPDDQAADRDRAQPLGGAGREDIGHAPSDTSEPAPLQEVCGRGEAAVTSEPAPVLQEGPGSEEDAVTAGDLSVQLSVKSCTVLRVRDGIGIPVGSVELTETGLCRKGGRRKPSASARILACLGEYPTTGVAVAQWNKSRYHPNYSEEGGSCGGMTKDTFQVAVFKLRRVLGELIDSAADIQIPGKDMVPFDSGSKVYRLAFRLSLAQEFKDWAGNRPPA